MRAVVIALLLGACKPVPPATDAFPPSAPRPAEKKPVAAPAAEAPPPAPPSPAAAPAAPAAPEAAPPPAAAAPAAEMSDAELLAIAMGVDPVKAAPPPAPLPLPAPLPAAAPPAWAPGTPLQGSWGVRVVGIIPSAQPPRAVLGLPDGREVVVEAGAFLESERVVVMAIGAEAVQIARVEPAGDRVKITNETLHPLYANPRPAAP
jgi:hypothetical protein